MPLGPEEDTKLVVLMTSSVTLRLGFTNLNSAVGGAGKGKESQVLFPQQIAHCVVEETI